MGASYAQVELKDHTEDKWRKLHKATQGHKGEGQIAKNMSTQVWRVRITGSSSG
jgi:hypothetical protein